MRKLLVFLPFLFTVLFLSGCGETLSITDHDWTFVIWRSVPQQGPAPAIDICSPTLAEQYPEALPLYFEICPMEPEPPTYMLRGGNHDQDNTAVFLFTTPETSGKSTIYTVEARDDDDDSILLWNGTAAMEKAEDHYTLVIEWSDGSTMEFTAPADNS